MARPPHEADKVQTDEQAIAEFAAVGFAAVTNLAHHGRMWRADATAADGTAVMVICHGKDGRVHVTPEDADDEEPPVA